ncbi:MAG: hypothetical protein M1818_002744 [Claussenomyces sp. TS43310]|nr:MAG: hypothetical protein M1818_002744 [Claussenomyces sp. TS43310]
MVHAILKANTYSTTAYGSEVSIPENVDMLIAGFSCVDFSALNNKKKNLSDGGESGDTLTAILKYANRYRPKIMILENVKGADWNHIKKVLVPDIGYCAEFSNSIDTKHYYLPQTRQRGYMVCIDRHLSKKLKLDPTRLVSDAMEKMGELKRPASSPVQAFLLDEDDPRIVRGHADMVDGGRGDNKRGNVDWTRCYGRHQDARTEHALGQMRPVMRWEDGGTCYPRDNMWIDWAKKQVERIWDLIDLFSLLSVKRGFDLEYKGRILDLSQNVDRGWDRTKAGLTPCLTPNGIPFSSWHGRPLVGLEVLALNALPINKLQFVLETQSMLQDLAGNAMTSTVVGAMILAVLSSAYPILESGEHSMEEDRSTLLSSICGEDDLVPLDCDIAHYPPLAVATAMQLAGKSRRLCLCEGQSVITSAQVQECGFCNHTTCVKCGGNPNHKYRPILRQVVDQRLLPIRFEELLKESLPMKVTIGGHSLDDINALRPASVAAEERWKPVFDRICKAFNSELRYYRVKRSHVWTVYYECEHARLELKLDSELAEWQLFAKPDASESGDSHVRKVLLQPVARMRPRRDGNDLLKGAWEICTMQTFAFDAQISGVGDLIKSFVASRGLADFIDTETFQAYSISVDDEDSIKRLDIDIRGIYEALPNCGGALGSLHRRQDDTKSAARMFFFLDPHPINHPTQDFFVFSHEKSRLRHDEARQTIARVDCSWRPPRIEKIKGTTSPVVTYRVDGKNKPCTEVELRQPRKVRFYSDGHWIDLDGAHLRPIGGTEAASYKCAPSNFSIEPPSDSCQSAHVVLSCKSVLPKYVKSPWQGKGLVEVDKNDHQDFFAAYTWLTEKVRVLPGLGDWKEVEGADAVRCHRCAPVLPKIRWTLGKDDKLFPVEDPREALPYERTIKARPSALVVQVSIDSDGHTELKLAVNPETLMHRALAKLPVSDSHRVTLSWRLVTDWIPPSKISPPEFRIPSNENGGMANQPPGFKKPLRPEQLESLKWMLDQEAERVIPFMEEEVEEATIPQIGWRAEGRGTIPVFIRGGVLADEVGFGKTITTLALIASHRDRDSKAAKLAISSRIPVKATLILVPDHIIMQWYDATRDFLSHADYKVVTIKKMADLEKRTIREFQEADIIIVSWNLLKIDTYFFRLAEFSGLLELPANAGTRAEATWYERALEKVSQHTGKLQQDGKGLKDMIEASLQASREEALRQETFTPSKRLRGRAYQNAKQAKSAGQKRTADEMSKVRGAKNQNAFEKPIQRGDPFGLYPITQGKRSWSTMKCPLLELFEFSRLVVDEYTYVSGNHSTIMCNLQAKSRWVLSGTPPLEDFADVKSISKFLGINLGVDDLTTVVTKSANIKALSKDRTGSEEFRFLKQTQSAAWHDNRHRIAQRFLDHFARQNKAKIGTLPKSDHILSIRQPAAERALYLELVQILAATNFSIKKGRANVDNDRARRIHELVGSSDSATEALLKCASHFTLEDLNDGSTTALQACDVIVAVRQKQYIKLKAAFESKLMQTEWLCRTTELPCIQYTNWKRSIDENNLGDRETADEIKALYQNAERNFKENHGRIFYVTAEKAKTKDKNELRRIMPEPGNTHILELRNRVADLGNLRRELLARKRALRFFKSVRLLQRLYSERSEQVIQATCSCSVCHKKHGSSQSFSVQTLCGHIICDTCVSHRTPESTCGVSGCGAVNKDYQVLSAHELGKDDDHVGKHYGKKIESLVSLIKNIDKTEQVLVFVQFPDLMKKINTAFEDHNISFTELRTAKIQSSELNAFQHGDKKMGKKQVLILNLGDASASGSNLTGANHVVFVSPCLTERQQTYDAQMTQAIGRALRYGQTKHVHVYHYLTLNTVDVDTIQARTGKMLKKGCDNDPLNVYKAPFESFSPSGLALLDAMPGDSGEFGSMIAGLVDEVED